MADFVAVLKKTIDAQADKSPELRQRVYAKARATIEQKLVTANASQAVAVRQRKLLEDAIEETETFYAPSEPVVEEPLNDPLEDFLQESTHTSQSSSHGSGGEAAAEPLAKLPDENGLPENDASSARSSRDDEWAMERDHDRIVENESPRRSEYTDPDTLGEKRSYKGLIAGLVAILLLGGAGYGIWANKDKLQEFASSIGRSDAPGDDTQSQSGEETPPADEATGGEETPQTPAEEQKLTQRLMPDGSEVDEGPAGGEAGIGEGTSTAASTPSSTSGAGAANQNQPQPGQAVAVGQQALLYEERGGTDSGSVERGNVVWSVIEESPNEGEPAEPAIRGNVTMPDSKVELKMTIRKNTDQSIPASHLIEMVFTVPEDFSGGVVDNVQRITFKDTEQAAGNPLIAVPSKIADNFFIIWLNDARTAQDTNLSLMRRLQWIDIPVSYRNGRRALISLEKGVPGEKVFNEVLSAG
ncbi:transcriptional regulator [Falsochrobactrum sp. TDYN1]|uniref:Transcriptional regulator n=1 Tax=Falsochrobactrum tianjinense TaxID=2706015 RepID=A0A949UW47_9HYPH|nr:transcriptional regulator [Falsochrobactrum sp. TDYN1]MBV2144703.1 transcriptional regulator [Falsochrobactrum sp. TDYN1]